MARLTVRNPSNKEPRGAYRRLDQDHRVENLKFESQQSAQGSVYTSDRGQRGGQRRLEDDSCAGNQIFKSQHLETGLRRTRKIPEFRRGKGFTGLGHLNDNQSGLYGLGHHQWNQHNRKFFNQAYRHGALHTGRLLMTQQVGGSIRIDGPAHLSYTKPSSGHNEDNVHFRKQQVSHGPSKFKHFPNLTHSLKGSKGPTYHHFKITGRSFPHAHALTHVPTISGPASGQVSSAPALLKLHTIDDQTLDNFIGTLSRSPTSVDEKLR
ncbi:hypothetical protein F0562_025578 [Nyssa sinensis]|uniref:Uncharacterized protein n=1 Tax=Nyssa sinensis TaxID=561372 RepID=A0A5J5B947_9ASTE|nr:hypothetical protein F0562_025578 [Nyssa sinensis]